MRRVLAGEPEAGVVRKVLWIAQPASFAEVVPRRAHDRVVGAAPSHLRQELRDAPSAARALADVLAEGPPAEIVGAFDLAVGAREERDVLREELLGGGVRDGVRDSLLVIGVETAHVRREKFLGIWQLLGRRLEVETLVHGAPHVLRAAAAAVVPQHPAVVLLVAEDGRLVACARIPGAGIGNDERRLVDHLPVADAVRRDRATDVCGVQIGISDEEHRVAPVGQLVYLAARHAVAVPRFARAVREHHALLHPVDAVFRFRVAVAVRLVRAAARIPHAQDLALLVPHHGGAHHGRLLVRLRRLKDRLLSHALEVDAVLRHRIADAAPPLLLRALAGVP